MRKSKKFWALAIAWTLLVVVISSSGTLYILFGPSFIRLPFLGDEFQRLQQLKAFIQEHSLNPIDDEKLLIGAAKGMVAGTEDTYAYYYTPEEYNSYTQDEEGKYVGIGVGATIDPDDKTLTISEVYRNSLHLQQDCCPGDKVLKVNDEDVVGMDLNLIVEKIRGEAGTTVKLQIMRGNDTLDMELKRANVDVERVKWHMIDQQLGYIRIYEFTGSGDQQFAQAIQELIAQGAKGFILDIRNNPGGRLDVVTHIADSLLPKGTITMMENNQGKHDETRSDAEYLNMPLVVIVNQYSASASELLTIALQDYGMATIVGTNTYGKGVAQNFYTLQPDGAVLKITTDRYLSPKGRTVEKTGVTPDVIVELNEEVQKDASLWLTDKDNQYQKALEIVKSKIQ